MPIWPAKDGWLQMTGLFKEDAHLGDDHAHSTYHSTHMPRWPAPAYLPDAFWRTGHTVVSPSILADGPPELSKCTVLLQRVGTLGSEVLVHSWVPNGAIRHLHLFGQVLECPEMQKHCDPWVQAATEWIQWAARPFWDLSPAVTHGPHSSPLIPSSTDPSAQRVTCQGLILSKLCFLSVH